jgi:uncharacterized protein (TIGR00297 family)
MFTPTTITTAVIVLMAAVAYFFKLLTITGAPAAAATGLIALYAGGFPALCLLLVFFATSNLLGFWRRERKKSLGYEKGGVRDHWQVAANGGPAILGLLISRYILSSHLPVGAYLAIFAAGLAEANADTWATEIGSASNSLSYSILTGKTVPSGESGGISAVGTLAAAIAAALLGIVTVTLSHTPAPARTIAVVTVAGFCGAMIDSLLGAAVQAQYVDQFGKTIETAQGAKRQVRGIAWFRNDMVNFVSSFCAVALALSAFWQK